MPPILRFFNGFAIFRQKPTHMENKPKDIDLFYTSIRNIEAILRELLWRQILHTHNYDMPKSEDEFKRACGNIDADLRVPLEDLSRK